MARRERLNKQESTRKDTTHKQTDHHSTQDNHTAIHRLIQHHPSVNLSHQDIMALQRTIGNQGVINHLVARQSVGTATGLLTPAQVQAAISYHMNQPWKYTPAIISQIQTAVGTPPTGRMTAVDVQAVAAKQKAMNDAGETPELAVDGMAGPRTLPSVFKIGLAKQDEIDAYSEEANDLIANQGNKTDQEVAEEIFNTVNAQLVDEGIPSVEFEISPSIGGRGIFRGHEWKLYLHEALFTVDKHKDLQKTSSTIYHEARHAEQHYRVAQMLAGKGFTETQIVTKTGIRADIVAIACMPANHLLPGTMEALIAEGWFDSMFSKEGRAKISENNAAMDKAYAEREAAQAAYDANPTPENEAKLEAAKAEYQRTLDVHFDMPHEFDAERVEDKVDKAME